MIRNEIEEPVQKNPQSRIHDLDAEYGGITDLQIEGYTLFKQRRVKNNDQ